MSDVQLVYMPYVPVDHPSVGLSVLVSGLKAAGVDARVVYANMDFAQRIGLDAYQLYEFQTSSHFVEDWSFRDAVYGPSGAVPSWERDRSLEYHPRYVALLTEHRKKDLYAIVREIRDQASRFVVELAQRLLNDGAKIVGASTMHGQNLAALALMKAVKDLSPSTVTMLGGASCDAEMGVALHRRYPFVDYAVSGEPDAVLAGLCQRLLRGGGPLADAEVPTGFLHPGLRRTGRYPSPPVRLVLEDLEQAAIPDYDDYFSDLERTGLRDHLYLRIPMESARGCWYGQKQKCRFCSYQDEAIGYRSKSPDRVLGEMKLLWEKYGKLDLFMVDSVMDHRFLKTVLPRLVEAGAPYSIFWEVKASLKEPDIELLARAGVWLIEVGIESFVDPVLKGFRKGNTGIRCVQTLKHCMTHGVTAGWNFLYGAPQEQDEWYAELNGWLPLITHLQPPGYVIPIQFTRFSTYVDQAREFGLDLVPSEGYRDVHPFEDLGDLAFTFDEKRLAAEVDGAVHRKRTVELIRAWKQVYFSRMAPRLVYRDDGARIETRDTRPVATQFKLELEGVDRAVFLGCLQAQPVGQLLEQLSPPNGRWERQQLLEALARLAELKLLLRIGEQCLTLATPPVTRFPVFDRERLKRNDRYYVFERLMSKEVVRRFEIQNLVVDLANQP